MSSVSREEDSLDVAPLMVESFFLLASSDDAAQDEWVKAIVLRINSPK
jgi:ClpP class serine protease